MSAPWRGEMRFCFVASSQDEAGAIIDAATHALENCGLFVQGGSCEAMPAQYVIAGSPLAIALAAASGPDDFDGRRDQLHQQERAAAWEADATPSWSGVHIAGHDVRDVLRCGLVARGAPSASAERHTNEWVDSFARLRARDQSRTDALIEAAWSYRQKADEWDTVRSIGSAVVASTLRMAADTLTRIAHGDST